MDGIVTALHGPLAQISPAPDVGFKRASKETQGAHHVISHLTCSDRGGLDWSSLCATSVRELRLAWDGASVSIIQSRNGSNTVGQQFPIGYAYTGLTPYNRDGRRCCLRGYPQAREALSPGGVETGALE